MMCAQSYWPTRRSWQVFAMEFYDSHHHKKILHREKIKKLRVRISFIVAERPCVWRRWHLDFRHCVSIAHLRSRYMFSVMAGRALNFSVRILRRCDVFSAMAGRALNFFCMLHVFGDGGTHVDFFLCAPPRTYIGTTHVRCFWHTYGTCFRRWFLCAPLRMVGTTHVKCFR